MWSALFNISSILRSQGTQTRDFQSLSVTEKFIVEYNMAHVVIAKAFDSSILFLVVNTFEPAKLTNEDIVMLSFITLTLIMFSRCFKYLLNSYILLLKCRIRPFNVIMWFQDGAYDFTTLTCMD